MVREAAPVPPRGFSRGEGFCVARAPLAGAGGVLSAPPLPERHIPAGQSHIGGQLQKLSRAGRAS